MSCYARGSHGTFEVVTASGTGAVPTDERVIDIAILDMNHGWPNLGHGAIVHALQNIACDLVDELVPAGLRLRVVSYDVRRAHAVPPPPTDDGGLYVGTGGPRAIASPPHAGGLPPAPGGGGARPGGGGRRQNAPR